MSHGFVFIFYPVHPDVREQGRPPFSPRALTPALEQWAPLSMSTKYASRNSYWQPPLGGWCASRPATKSAISAGR
jgi:hypothetical protein